MKFVIFLNNFFLAIFTFNFLTKTNIFFPSHRPSPCWCWPWPSCPPYRPSRTSPCSEARSVRRKRWTSSTPRTRSPSSSGASWSGCFSWARTSIFPAANGPRFLFVNFLSRLIVKFFFNCALLRRKYHVFRSNKTPKTPNTRTDDDAVIRSGSPS